MRLSALIKKFPSVFSPHLAKCRCVDVYIPAPDFILFYFDEFFTPTTTNTLFVLDGHWGRKLLKGCSNTSLAIRVSALRMLCASSTWPGRGRGSRRRVWGIREGGWSWNKVGLVCTSIRSDVEAACGGLKGSPKVQIL